MQRVLLEPLVEVCRTRSTSAAFCHAAAVLSSLAKAQGSRMAIVQKGIVNLFVDLIARKNPPCDVKATEEAIDALHSLIAFDSGRAHALRCNAIATIVQCVQHVLKKGSSTDFVLVQRGCRCLRSFPISQCTR